jgi:hypothetical protein
VGPAAAPEADGARRASGREDGQGLLRIRREREAKAIDVAQSERLATPHVVDTHEDEAIWKAALWTAIAGIAHVIAPAFGQGFYPAWFFLLTAIAYGLMLPAIASLHVRHLTIRESGAMLGTISGTAVVVVGISASAAPELAVAALFVRAIWWWVIGKMWWETGVMPRWLGAVTLGLAVGEFALVLALGPIGADMAVAWLPLRVLLGIWLLALSYALWRSRETLAAE